MDVPLWIRLLGVVWVLIVLAAFLAVSRLDGGRRSAAIKAVLIAASVSSVIGLGLVVLYARHATVPDSPRATSTAGCDTPPAPPANAPPPSNAGVAPKNTDAKTADAKKTPNFLAFAACGEDPKSAPTRK
jgi:hypothetical protein